MSDVPVLSGGGLLGHLSEFRDTPLALLTRFNREIGDMGFLRFGNTRLLVVNTPELAHELLVMRHGQTVKSRVLRAGLYPLAGNGLFTSDGELWKRQRKLMAPIFTRAKIAHFDRSMTDCAARCVAGWHDGQSLDALHETTSIAMNVASRALFGVDTTGSSDELGQALTVALHWVAKAVTSLPFALQIELADGIQRAAGRLGERAKKAAASVIERVERPIMWPTRDNRQMQRALKTLEAHVAKMIADRRADTQPRADLLSRLLFAHEGSGETAMSDRQLRDEILTLFVAGHETTATALAWSLYLLARDADVRDALEREADALGDAVPTADDLSRLPLATRVFKEALRMYPPVPVYERQATEPIEIGGYPVTPGHYIAVLPWALHHRPELWPEPERFDPDRFLPKAEAQRDRYAWIPFGAGPRVCIGNHFALQEGPLVLAMIVRRARLHLVDPQAPIEPDPHAATLRPRGGVPMRLELRG